MPTFRTQLYSAQDPALGNNAPVQNTYVKDNISTNVASAIYPVTATAVTLATAVGMPTSNVKMVIITNLDAASVSDTVLLEFLPGTSTITLPAGGQFMVSGVSLNPSTWRLDRSIAGTTLVRIEFAQ